MLRECPWKSSVDKDVRPSLQLLNTLPGLTGGSIFFPEPAIVLCITKIFSLRAERRNLGHRWQKNARALVILIGKIEVLKEQILHTTHFQAYSWWEFRRSPAKRLFSTVTTQTQTFRTEMSMQRGVRKDKLHTMNMMTIINDSLLSSFAQCVLNIMTQLQMN